MDAMLEMVLFTSIQKLEATCRESGLPIFNSGVTMRIADKSKKYLGKKKITSFQTVENPIAVDP